MVEESILDKTLVSQTMVEVSILDKTLASQTMVQVPILDSPPNWLNRETYCGQWLHALLSIVDTGCICMKNILYF